MVTKAMINIQNVEKLREVYPAGTRVCLLSNMKDPYGQGEKAAYTGSVAFVDDAGQIHVKWDNGGSIAIIPTIDSFTKI